MKLRCEQCHCPFGRVDEWLGGKQARCEACGFEFVIPFHDADALLEWAESAPWPLIEEGLRTGVARHQPARVVSQWVRLFEKRREREIWRLEREEHGRVRSRQDRLLEAEEKRREEARELGALEAMSPGSLCCLVMDLFLAKGFSIKRCESRRMHRRDFVVFREDGEQEAVVRCLARESTAKATSRDLRHFAAACALEGGAKGYLVTSGQFTRNARTAAARHPWLTLHDGESLLKWVRRARKDKALPLLLTDYDPIRLLTTLKARYESKLISKAAFDEESARILEDL